MFIIWYLMALGIMVSGAFSRTGINFLIYVIGFGLLGAIDMLVCNIVVRLRKKSEYEEWIMEFNDATFKINKENMNKCHEVDEL